jgi:hypothetical protein
MHPKWMLDGTFDGMKHRMATIGILILAFLLKDIVTLLLTAGAMASAAAQPWQGSVGDRLPAVPPVSSQSALDAPTDSSSSAAMGFTVPEPVVAGLMTDSGPGDVALDVTSDPTQHITGMPSATPAQDCRGTPPASNIGVLLFTTDLLRLTVSVDGGLGAPNALLLAALGLAGAGTLALSWVGRRRLRGIIPTVIVPPG